MAERRSAWLTLRGLGRGGGGCPQNTAAAEGASDPSPRLMGLGPQRNADAEGGRGGKAQGNPPPPPPPCLTWACPNTAAPCFRGFGSVLKPSFLRFPSNRECGLCGAGGCVQVDGKVLARL